MFWQTHVKQLENPFKAQFSCRASSAYHSPLPVTCQRRNRHSEKKNETEKNENSKIPPTMENLRLMEILDVLRRMSMNLQYDSL
jgi:hypothetical protein